MLLLIILTSMLQFIWSVIAIIPRLFGIQLYKIEKQDKLNMLYSKIKYSTIMIESEPRGWFISEHFYIGYIGEHAEDKGNYCYVLTKQKYLSELSPSSGSNTDIIEEVYRDGNYFSLRYDSMTRSLGLEATSPQQIVMAHIKKYYAQHKKCICFIQGRPGTGKSSIVRLLAKDIKTVYCNTFNPTEPGDTFQKLYAKVNPTLIRPLLLMIDEINGILSDITNNRVDRHKHIPVLVQNKESWNRFSDNLAFYQHVIVIYSSNKSIETIIDETDPSFLRPGRVNLYFDMQTPIEGVTDVIEMIKV
jgi:hypothetical protein